MWGVLEIAGAVLFLLSSVAVLVFVVLYGLRSHWRATPAGRVTFGFMAVVASIMVSAIVFGLWDGHDRERLVVRTVLYGLLFAGICRYIGILWVAQRADRRERAGRHRSGEDA